MRKYGIDNFKFSVLEECDKEDLNEKEKYWIEKYDSYNNGYNNTCGGDNAPHPTKITSDKLIEIDRLLSEMKLSIREIANKFDVSYEMIQGINTGRYWHRDIDYPIAKYLICKNNIKHNCCIDCGKQIDKNATRCIECANIYRRKVVRPDLLTLLKMVASIPITQIGKIYGVSGNAVKKWCIGYGIPHRKDYAIKYMNENNFV